MTDVSFKGSINNYSLRYPQISEDKEVTSKILVNDQTIVEKRYTINKTNIEVDRESNAPSVLSTTGSMDISESGELLSHNEEFRLASNKYEYDTGTTIKIKLKNKNLNKFAKIGNFNPAKANVQNNITTANSKVNENGVILKEPRGDVYFQVTNLTEDEVTIKIVKGKASKGILYKVDWAALGVSREPVKDTLKLYHSDTKKFGPTEEEITVTKDGEEGNLNGQFSPTMTFEWIYPKKNAFDTNGTWLADYLELGNVAMRYVNAANNNSILKAKSIVKDGTAEVDKFATSTPTKDFTEVNVATESNNTTKKVETQNGNIKTTTATAPYIIKGADNKYYIFKEYLKNSPYNRTSTSGTVYDAVSNIVAAYDEAKYGKVTVKYVKANDTTSVIKENVIKDGTAKLENIVGNNYSVTPDEEFTENGIVYKLVKTDLPNNSSGTLTENPIDVIYKYVAKNQKANVVVKTTDGKSTTTVELTGEPGASLPNSDEIVNKIKELKGKGYEIESDSYNINGVHPNFDDQEDTVAGVSKPSQIFEIVLKPRIVEVPSSTPHEKDSPVDPNGENPDLKWPDGLKESDLNTTAKRVISYVKKDSDTAPEVKAKDDTVQTVPFTRKASVNLVTKEVTYTDWESPNKTWDKVGVDVLPGYIADKKEIPAKEAVTPAKDTKVIPDETDKVTYTKIGSWIPVDPTTGKDGEPIPFPNDPNDPTKTGEITQIIPHKDGYTPKDGNGTPLEPVNPANPEQGYKPPKITDPKTNIKITYDKDDQKAKVKFVSVDDKGVETPLDAKYDIDDLTGKSGDKIPEEKVQARIDVLKSMGYDVVDNPFDQDPTFDTKKEIDQEFTIKVKPQVSTAKPVYVVEGDKPSSEKLKDAVTTKGNEKTVDETKIPETNGKVGDDTLTAPVTVTYGSGDNKREETVNVPVKVVKGYPQLVAVSEGKKQPLPEDSIDPADYPDDATFEYKEEVDTTTPGDKKVTVVVKQGDKVLVEVPATVRVVDSKPQFVVADKANKQPEAKQSITPGEYPDGTEFTYETPVDTTTSGEKDVVVVAKIGEDTIVKVPAKVVVVDPKTQYVFEDPAKTQPSADESIDPEQYPEGTKFTYKDGDVDTTTPGDKKVTVVAKDGEDKLVEVPTVVKVLPVVKPTGVTVLKDSTDLETMVKAKAEEVVAALPKDKIPEGVTVKVKEVKEKPETTATGEQKPAKVVIEYTDDKGRVVGSKEVEVPVTVVGSTPKSLVVFEGDTVEAKTVQDAVTPGANGTKGNPVIPEDLTKTTGKKEVTVPVTYDGIKDPEQVKVPVTVLPVAKGEVTVPKGETTDKVKEVAKAKAEEVASSADFKAKLPDGAKDVEVGAITEEVLATITSEAGTNKGTVKVPVTYTVDGVKYTKDAEITVSVVGSNADQVYVVEGDKPEIAKVKDAVTPGQGGTVQDPTEADLPDTKDKVGATDVTVPTKVKYANGEETVKVPVTVLPKVTPEGVTVLKDSDKQELEKAIKEQAEKAANNVKGLPSGVTVRVTEVKTGTVPPTATVGVQNPATVVVEYVKDGKVVATKEVPVPVNVVEVVPVSIETPVTSTPLTPEDYTKGINIPEGG